MHETAEEVTRIIKNTVFIHNDLFPHKKLFIFMARPDNPRELVIQSFNIKIKVTISQLILNSSGQQVPHLAVRITNKDQEFNYEYFTAKNIWWSTDKEIF